MDTPAISAEPIDGYLESCYAAFLRGDSRPELPPEIEDALDSEARGRIDGIVERLRRQAEARRGRRKWRCKPKTAAASPPREWPEVPGYEITGLLGEGGFGRVYRAISRRHFGVPVAVKILRPQVLSMTGRDASERRLMMSQLLVDEARILAHIGHRNVVRYLGSGIIETGPEAGTPFIATELIDGQSLAKRIGEAPRIRAGRPASWAGSPTPLDFVHQLKLQTTGRRGRRRRQPRHPAPRCQAIEHPPGTRRRAVPDRFRAGRTGRPGLIRRRVRRRDGRVFGPRAAPGRRRPHAGRGRLRFGGNTLRPPDRHAAATRAGPDRSGERPGRYAADSAEAPARRASRWT